MKKVVKGKYIDGVVRLPDDFKIKDNVDVYLIVEENKEKNIIEETFGIWIDDVSYLDKLREESESRINILGIK